MNKKMKKPTLGKVIIQWVITVILVIFIGSMVVYSVELISDSISDNEYRWLLGDLNDGNYADCVESYIVSEHLGEIKDEKFEQFDEFELFYREYILCLEYRKAINPGDYEEEMQECIANMEGICENSEYSYNIPHYEYLLSLVT